MVPIDPVYSNQPGQRREVSFFDYFVVNQVYCRGECHFLMKVFVYDRNNNNTCMLILFIKNIYMSTICITKHIHVSICIYYV